MATSFFVLQKRGSDGSVIALSGLEWLFPQVADAFLSYQLIDRKIISGNLQGRKEESTTWKSLLYTSTVETLLSHQVNELL